MKDDQPRYIDERNKPRTDTALPDSLMPDAAYRPIPIAWLAGAMILHGIAVCIVYAIFYSKDGWFTVAGGLLVTIYILSLTWKRGMSDAGIGWRVATVTLLGINLVLVSLAALARGN